MVRHLHDLAKNINTLGWVHGLVYCFPNFKHSNIELRLEETGQEWIVMETEIVIAVGLLHLELSAYQVSMISATNWPR